VVAQRLRRDCKLREGESFRRADKGFVIRDLPFTEEKLRSMPPFEFENWAVIAIGGTPNRVKVGDWGIDGKIYPISSHKKVHQSEIDFGGDWIPIQVKQKDKAGRPDIDSRSPDVTLSFLL